MTETFGNKVWPEPTHDDIRHVVKEAALHMSEERDGSAGVTVAKGQFLAKWTVLDAFGEPPNDEPFVVLRHRPTHEIVGFYRTYWPNEVDEVESLDDVFVAPQMIPTDD